LYSLPFSVLFAGAFIKYFLVFAEYIYMPFNNNRILGGYVPPGCRRSSARESGLSQAAFATGKIRVSPNRGFSVSSGFSRRKGNRLCRRGLRAAIPAPFWMTKSLYRHPPKRKRPMTRFEVLNWADSEASHGWVVRAK
jgi:hypothetical protein